MRPAMVLLAVAAVARGAPGAPDVAYVLEVSAEPAVRVTLRAAGEGDGTTELGVSPSWGGFEGFGREILELEVRGEDGSARAVERASEHSWVVAHEPGERLEVAYVLRPVEREPLGRGRNDYRTRLGPGLFQMVGNMGLVAPRHLEDGRARRVRFEWRGLEEAGWSAASSFGPGAGPHEAVLPLSRARHAMFIAGRLRVHEREVDGGRLGVAIVPDDWGFEDGRLVDLAARVVEAGRAFFDDRTDPWFLITMTPTGRATADSLSLGGTGLTNGFALYCNTGLDLAPGSGHETPLLRLLAHEYLHTWIGMRVRVEAPEGAAYWFTEGFTDFLTRRVLGRAGLWDERRVVEDLNTSLGRYDRSPVRHAPNGRIVADFWADPDVMDLPYRRGDLLALAIDERIREASGGERSLDDLMRELCRRAGAGAPALSMDGLLGEIERWTTPAFAARVRGCVERGEEVPLPARVSEPALRLGTGSVRHEDPGFDVEASRAAGRIVGVREGTGAHEAGVRDGMALRAVRTEPTGPGRPPMLVVELEEGGGARTVRFEAVGVPVELRRYEPAGG